jgi:ATP phosphoribosyltransferase regulatory subunit
MDTLMAGGAIDRSTILQLQGADDETLGLRPELTASIARSVVNRFAGTNFPQRLYYNANVFCRPPAGSHSSQQEFYQAGVELLGSAGLLADAEVLLLLIDCLANVGLGDASQPQWQIILGEAGLTRSLLSVFPADQQAIVRAAIAHLDLIALENLDLAPDLHQRALQMFDLRGESRAVLETVNQWDLSPTQRQQVEHLQTLFALLSESLAVATPLPIVLDLSLVRTFDYYTGLVFEVAYTGATSSTDDAGTSGLQLLAQGGRYDQLLGLYHPQHAEVPGIGFCFQIEQLQQVLLSANHLPRQATTSDWLVVSVTPAADAIALAHAHKLRQSAAGIRVELNLDHADRATVLRYAQIRRIAQIAWIKPGGEVQVE